MKKARFGNKIVIRIDKGEEIFDCVKRVCTDEMVRLGSVQGIGACGKLTIGYLESAKKEYRTQDLEGDYEISPLLGNVTHRKGEIFLHLHATVADSSGNARGGHLSFAIVSGTFEVIVEVFDGSIEREYNADIGLNILKM